MLIEIIYCICKALSLLFGVKSVNLALGLVALLRTEGSRAKDDEMTLSQQSLLNMQTAEGDFPIVFGKSPCFHSQYDHGHNQEILASIRSYL